MLVARETARLPRYRRVVAALVTPFVAILLAAPVSAADTTSEKGTPKASALAGAGQEPLYGPDGNQSTYMHWYSTLALGRGVRFNNPYRLSEQLGDTPESLSLSAPYIDVGLGTLLGKPEGFQQGVAVTAAFAIDGIPQEVITPGYVAYYPLAARWALRGRAGIPVVIEPDATLGVEIAAEGVYLLTAALGLTASVVGSAYYGAATIEESVTVIPLLAFQVGVLVDYEVLP